MASVWDLFDESPDGPSVSTIAQASTTPGVAGSTKLTANSGSQRLHMLAAHLRSFIGEYGQTTAGDLLDQRCSDSGLDAALLQPAVLQLVQAVDRLHEAFSPSTSGDIPPVAIAVHALEIGAYIVGKTWTWQSEHRSWPHVAWREAYVMGQLVCAVSHLIVPGGNAREAMRCADLAIILGAPPADVRDLIFMIEAEVLESQERSRAQGMAQGGPHLPVIPAVLQADATLQLPESLLPTSASTTIAGPPCSLLIERRRGKPRHPGRPLYQAPAGEHPTLAALRSVTGPLLSAAEFHNQYAAPPAGPGAARPMVIQGAIDDWPALAKWRDLRQLSTRFGHRTVPVELGSHLTSSWSEKSMRLDDFLSKHIAPSITWGWGRAVWLDSSVDRNGELIEDAAHAGHVRVHPDRVAYLAQHSLLDQLPDMSRDLDMPLYAGGADGQIGAVNAWLGTAGTVTRCHYDTYENTLCQVVGYKFVRLYSPADSARLYPIDNSIVGGQAGDTTTAQGNVSAVDVECDPSAPAMSSFPAFRDAVAHDTVLGPGDCLFIPKGWWHYVRALTPSFSVNFWY